MGKPPSCFHLNKQCWGQWQICSCTKRKTRLGVEHTVLSAFAPKLPHSSRGKGTLNWGSTQCTQKGGISCFVHSPCEVSLGAKSAGEVGCCHLLWQCPPLHCFTLRALLDMSENLIFKKKEEKRPGAKGHPILEWGVVSDSRKKKKN